METILGTSEHIQVVTVGHVDHGKSSLLGRLYLDMGIIPESLVERVKTTCELQGKIFEPAFLFDAFLEEQEQGITIDTARTFFTRHGRRYAIMDAPGHLEFLKNMVTGASRAQAAILLIDAAEGVMDQSRRHGHLLHLLGLHQVVVVVNKMDLQDYRQEAFQAIVDQYGAFLQTLGMRPTAFIPASAREGENVASRGARMPWYTGPTLLESLEAFSAPPLPEAAPLRFVIQDVYKFDERRILAGRVEAGTLRAGDALRFSPSGKVGVVKRIEAFPEGATPPTTAGWSTGITLTQQLFLERGEVASHEPTLPSVTDRFAASVFWMGQTPITRGNRYVLRLATQEVAVEIESLVSRLDAGSLDTVEDPTALHRHEVGEVILRTLKPLALDRHLDCTALGRFVLVEGYDIRGGGTVREILPSTLDHARQEAREREQRWREGEILLGERVARNGHGPALVLFEGPAGSGKARLARLLERRLFDAGRQVLLLDSKNFRAGISADLGQQADTELTRRFGEVAALLLRSGFLVACVTNDIPEELHPLLTELAHPHPVLSVRLMTHDPMEGDRDGVVTTPVDNLPQAAALLQDRLEGLSIRHGDAPSSPEALSLFITQAQEI